MLPIILVALALTAVAWLGWTWNRLVALRAAVRAAWASIDALLKRRAELVPNLVSVVRGYMDYEADTLKRVVEARTSAVAASESPDDLAARERAEDLLTGTVRQLFALVESYPELRANARVLAFQQELVETEDDLAMARRYYNAVVRDFNILRETFPTVLVAGMFGFREARYFELAGPDEAAVPDAGLGGEE
jgi:LemA protein